MALDNIGYILIGVIVITVLVLFGLWLFEKKLKKKVVQGRNTRNNFYLEKLGKIDTSSLSKSLKSISKIAKNFFAEAFKIKGVVEYSELRNFFKKKNNKKARRFCEVMTEIYYTKESINKNQIKELTNLLQEIISSNHIILEEEKKELDKKSIEKQKQAKIKKKVSKAN